MHLLNHYSLPCNYRAIELPDPAQSHQLHSQLPMKTQKPSERAKNKNLEGKMEKFLYQGENYIPTIFFVITVE